MLGITSCKISLPTFSLTPDPSQLVEIIQAAEEMDRLSLEVSFFSRSSPEYPLKESARVCADRTRHSGPVPDRFASIFADGCPDEMDIEEGYSSSLDFPQYDTVRENSLDDPQSPFTFHTDSSSFASFAFRDTLSRHESGRYTKDNLAHEADTCKIFKPYYASFVQSRIPASFCVYVDPPDVKSPDIRTYDNNVATNTQNRVRHGGKENENRQRPAIRRKPIPNLVIIDDNHSSAESLPRIRTEPLPTAVQPLSVSKPEALDPTDTIGDYALTRFLSQGAQGKVYLAKSKQTQKVVAIKVISKLARENCQTLLQEQKLLKRLKGHPFVLNMIDSLHDTENFYLITEYYPGGDLAHLLHKKKVLDTDMTRFYISELVVAIKFLHSNSIIHRDLKPSNILIKADGHICVVDFGLCKDFHSTNTRARALAKHGHRHMVTTGPKTDGFAGTLVYMSPQVISQELYSYETDWWSMGIIMYELLQGDTPWTGSDVTCMMRKIRKEPLIFRTEIDDAASDLLVKLLQKRVEDRIHVSEFTSHDFFRSIDLSAVDSGSLLPPYRPQLRGSLAVGVLKDKERVHVGRAYDTCRRDPFPEYNYEHAPTDPHNDVLSLRDDGESSGPLNAPATPRHSAIGMSNISLMSPLRLDGTISSESSQTNNKFKFVSLQGTSGTLSDSFYTPRRSFTSSMAVLSSASGLVVTSGSRAPSKARRVYSTYHECAAMDMIVGGHQCPLDGSFDSSEENKSIATSNSMSTVDSASLIRPKLLFPCSCSQEHSHGGAAKKSLDADSDVFRTSTCRRVAPEDDGARNNVGGERRKETPCGDSEPAPPRGYHAANLGCKSLQPVTLSCLTPPAPSLFTASRSSLALTTASGLGSAHGNSIFSVTHAVPGGYAGHSVATTVPSVFENSVGAQITRESATDSKVTEKHSSSPSSLPLALDSVGEPARALCAGSGSTTTLVSAGIAAVTARATIEVSRRVRPAPAIIRSRPGMKSSGPQLPGKFAWAHTVVDLLKRMFNSGESSSYRRTPTSTTTTMFSRTGVWGRSA